MQLTDLPWLQMSGAMAGGLVGSFSGFIANSVHEQGERRRVRRNIACAVIGEIGALSDQLEGPYMALLRTSMESYEQGGGHLHHHFRADRDYMPVFRAIGGSIGYLPTPLPRDLVAWYTALGTTLERARAIHELAVHHDPDLRARAIELVRVQHTSLTALLESAKPLLERLGRL